jgi:hypothetical protein
MKSNRLGLAGALVAGAIALCPAAPAWADTLVGPTNAATGINGLVLNFGPGPITYDVTFVNAAFTTAYPTGLNFNNLSDATTAANALSMSLQGLGVTGLTGVTANPQFAFVPYALTGSGCSLTPCVQVEAAQQVSSGQSIWQLDSGLAPLSQRVAIANGDYAVFTVVAVPGPIVGAGIPGLVAACGLLLLGRRRKQIAP